MTRLGQLRGYDPHAEQAFTRRAPGVNPIALELQRLAELRGLRRSGTMRATEEYEPPPFTEEELAREQMVEEPRNARGQTQGEERDEDAARQAYHNPVDKMMDYLEAGRGGDYYYEARERMSPVEQGRFDRLDQRVEDISNAIGDYIRSHPGAFQYQESEGEGDFSDTPNTTQADRDAMTRFFNRRNRLIDIVGRLQRRAHGRGGQ